MTETYRSSATAKLRDITRVPVGVSVWESRLAKMTGVVEVTHTKNRLQFTGMDPINGRPLRRHDGPSAAVQDSVGNPPGQGRQGEFTCNGWKHLFDTAGRRLDAIAPEFEGDVR